jgi:glycosyltransferase involved in cell wall biosynthesis
VRCAWFLTDLGGGGAERLPLLLAPAFRQTELQLILLKDRVEHSLPHPPPVIVPLGPADARLGSRALPLLARAIEAARSADVLVGGMEWEATLAAVACAVWLGKPVIGLVHIDLQHVYGPRSIPSWRWKLFAAALRRCDAVVGVSRDGIASAGRLGVAKARQHLIPNPAPVVGEPRTSRATDGPSRILTVGRLMAMKGIDVILAAAARIDAPFRWDILGDGPDRSSLERLAEELAVSDRVRFQGFVPDAQPFFSAADLFVMASRMEGMPLAMTEAMARGLPVVATRCNAGVEELVGEGQDAAGILVPVDDDAALAEAVRRMLEDPDEAARLGEAARRRVSALAPDRIAARYEELFRAVLDPAARALGSA